MPGQGAIWVWARMEPPVARQVTGQDIAAGAYAYELRVEVRC